MIMVFDNYHPTEGTVECLSKLYSILSSQRHKRLNEEENIFNYLKNTLENIIHQLPPS